MSVIFSRVTLNCYVSCHLPNFVMNCYRMIAVNRTWTRWKIWR